MPITYKVNIQIDDKVESIVFRDITAPVALCTLHPDRDRLDKLVDDLCDKYHNEILRKKAWSCWFCKEHLAVKLIHAPLVYLDVLDDPQILDWAKPLCNDPWCAKEADAIGEAMQEMDDENRKNIGKPLAWRHRTRR